MAKVEARATDYYNLVIGRLNKLIDDQIKLISGNPIGDATTLNFITGTINGLKIAIDNMKEIVVELDKGKVALKASNEGMTFIYEDNSIKMPQTLKRDFKYE